MLESRNQLKTQNLSKSLKQLGILDLAEIQDHLKILDLTKILENLMLLKLFDRKTLNIMDVLWETLLQPLTLQDPNEILMFLDLINTLDLAMVLALAETGRV
ncbi:hypothetical protein Q5P01_021898 [Channa striata]|uniref:Uncharacterized protein n=1 Tax=Channa striata TaxID=64152 RepID=A0AA88S769_CHASR|nr:hypothetical protein Q5P01_021898 [Channa striata]